MAGETTTAAPAAAETKAATVPPASGEKPVEVLGKDGKPFDPERAQATIETLRAEVKTNKAAAEELEALKAKQIADEEERKRKQGEFETLANDYKSKFEGSEGTIKELKTREARYQEILAADIDKRIEKWPDSVKKLIPKDGDALERLERVSEMEQLANELLQTPAAGGVRPGPVPNNNRPSGEAPPPPAGYRI